MEGIINVPLPRNEPVLDYAPGNEERDRLKAQLLAMQKETIDIPLIIGGREVRTGDLGECRCPHNHSKVLATYHKAGPREIQSAVNAVLESWEEWSRTDWIWRASILLRAAALLSSSHRMVLNSATMLGQSKTVHQAEIDAACELIDFFRFNPWYMRRIYADQPASSATAWNYMEYRSLEGFVFAVSPFNFTSIAGNLPTAPALMGNTVLWKPASSAVYPAYHLMLLWKAAGLPEGVINFLPGSGSDVGPNILSHNKLAGVHFTGSTAVFQSIWETIGQNIKTYRTYPRIVGETGGKGFVFVHASADRDEVATALIRGAFEYQGQKCSAASRAYIPSGLWPALKEKLTDELKTISMGDISDFAHFMGAVIDRPAFDRIQDYIRYARSSPDAEIITGGEADNSQGYFISPTLIEVKDPNDKLMRDEIFGPVLTLYVYPDQEFTQTLELCDKTSTYGLTGSVFARDRKAIETAYQYLKYASGNFYINDKPTGAVVSQQPFGGARSSGTDDKAGSYLNLLRWISARSIKESLVPPKDYRYLFQGCG